MAENTKPQFAKKFLLISPEGGAVDLAWQIRKEGNEVRMYIDENDEKDNADGFIEKTSDWEAEISWADVIIFDDVGFGKTTESLRKAGKAVVGGTLYTDQLEMDREFGQSEMKSVGMTVLPHWEFDNFDIAIQFLKDNSGRYVFKPSGKEKLDWDLKSLLFIGQEDDGVDIIGVLEHNKKVWSKKIKKFQIQKYAAGVEIAVGAFFNGRDFIHPFNINFEHKKLFPGDIGPYTGEMGTLMFWSRASNLFNATLAKMREKLSENQYIGYIDINCIANSKGIYPLEFTTRFGYPTISIQMEGVTSNWGELLYALATGEEFDLKTKRGFQVGAVIAMPPFPFDDKKEFSKYKDLTILFKKPNYDGVHLGGVKLVDNDWHLAGESGYVLVITASNSTVENARRNLYRRIENIMLQNMFYRTDIGVKWYHESDQLQTWGVL